MKKENFDLVITAAFEAASLATAKTIKDNPDVWYPCGFAWVKIRPARGAFVNYLKEKQIGRLSDMGGWDIWNPSNNATQWMTAKEEGARAFAKVLREHNI
jgi:hypothetical protein